MRSTGVPDYLPAMPSEEWEAWPDIVWRFVEAEARRDWPFKCREAIAHAWGEQDDVNAPGWLTAERGRYAEAIDVPIGRLFTAGSILARATGRA